MNKTPMCVTWDIYFFKKKHRINHMTLPETNSEFTPEKCMGIFIPFLSFLDGLTFRRMKVTAALKTSTEPRKKPY